MGGFGSGRRKYATTPTVEACRQLDVNAFTDIVDHPGRFTVMTWGGRADPAERIAVEMLPTPEDTAEAPDRATALRLSYTVTDDRAGEERQQSYVVALDYISCNYGGSRPWFRCPRCDERRGKLYRPPGRDLFLCRECYDLGYESSRTSHDELKVAARRYRHIHRQLTGEPKRPKDGPILPERPSGLHLSTYNEYCEQLLEASEAVDDVLMSRALRMAGVADLEYSPPEAFDPDTEPAPFDGTSH